MQKLRGKLTQKSSIFLYLQSRNFICAEMPVRLFVSSLNVINILRYLFRDFAHITLSEILSATSWCLPSYKTPRLNALKGNINALIMSHKILQVFKATSLTCMCGILIYKEFWVLSTLDGKINLNLKCPVTHNYL